MTVDMDVSFLLLTDDDDNANAIIAIDRMK